MPKKRMGKKLKGTSKKKRTTKKRKDTKKKRQKTEDQYKKYERGGRVEAYTMGEAMGSKKWP